MIPKAKKPRKKALSTITNEVRDEQWDDWVPSDRVRKLTEENKEIAAQLHHQMKQQHPGSKSFSKGSKGKPNGSDFSSARGSEERHTSVAAPGGRGGARRHRDYDLENVSTIPFLLILFSFGHLSVFSAVACFAFCGHICFSTLALLAGGKWFCVRRSASETSPWLLSTFTSLPSQTFFPPPPHEHTRSSVMVNPHHRLIR